MEEQKYITKEERLLAEADTLPKNENPNLYITLPYFLQASLTQAKKLGLEEHEGHRIFTTMDLRYQEAAQSAIVKNVQLIESEYPIVKKIKTTKKLDLESALVSVDLATGGVRAVVGGRSFHKTQFNRILFAKRQVGSTFKPMVYLTALNSKDKDFNPDDELKDEPFTYKYEKQKWTPENYEKKNNGPVPMYFALKESLNLATAKLALEIGLNPIIEMARLLGVTSDLKPVPSLSLGAFELNPMELAQAYMTVARFGNFIDYTFLDYIEDAEGNLIWDSNLRKNESRISPVATQVLIGILKQTALSGTARRIKMSGFDKVVAGKTGTTNDYRDSWFVGFTPDLLTIVWTGYDDNTSSGLTGASGSLPAWIEYMKVATQYDSVRDFPWTEEVEKKSIPTFHSPLEKPKSNDESSDLVELIFKK
jgi:penicillin-binding protein 1B